MAGAGVSGHSALMKRLCILGSTGSVGRNCLRVVSSLPERFRVVALSAGKNLDVLAQQVVDFSPEVVVVGSAECVEPLRERLRQAAYRKPLKILAGTEGQVEAVGLPEVDFVVSASHGVTGLVATYEAVLAGKQIGLASKEVMVSAGELVTRQARERGVDILPIDSEHSAIHQCLRSGQPKEVKRLILTASGGPFLKTPRKVFDSLTPEQALQHPIWKMGGRITVAESTVIRPPIFQIGCCNACSGVSESKTLRGVLRNGPPEAVRMRRLTSLGWPERRHW